MRDGRAWTKLAECCGLLRVVAVLPWMGSLAAKAAPPSGEGRGRQTGTLLSPVLKAKYRTFLSEPYGSVSDLIK